jgi:hypothetical protein
MEDSDQTAANFGRVLGEFPEEEPVRDFAAEVSSCELELMAYRSAVTEVRLTTWGLSTIRSLDDIEAKHDQLIGRIANLREACIQESLEPVSGIESTKSADREFRSYVRDGTATNAVESLDETAARVEQQIENKRTVVIARLSLAVAVASLFISTLIFFSGGTGIL